MIQTIFRITANSLMKIARLMKLTYNEINIIVYYFIIPLSWTILIDICLGSLITTPIFLAFCCAFFFKVRKKFHYWCDWAYYKSVDFLNYFNRFGINYVLSSVIICVLVPLLIYVGLFLLVLT